VRVPAALYLGLVTAVLVAAGAPIGARQGQAPGQPPRDTVTRPQAAGTGVIRGHVVAADTGSPVRHATVSISRIAPPPPPPTANGSAQNAASQSQSVQVLNGRGLVTISSGGVNVNRPQNATTDSQGAFEFTGLAEGSYRVSANAGQYSAAYLGMSYGAKTPTGPMGADPGQAIVLAAGQTFDKATIALPRGAVIAGRVSDENSEALARVQVYTLYYPPGSSRGQRMGNTTQTDDLGQFRLFGLQPGDYVVVAEARAQTFVAPNAPPETEEDRNGFMTTYYPGTADPSAAQKIRARSGTETSGVEIRLVTGRLFHISGIVTDSQGHPVRANGQLATRGPGSSGFSSFGFSTDASGAFQMRNIPPGSYHLVVRQMQVIAGRGGAAGDVVNFVGGRIGGPGADPMEMATVPLTIAADMDGLSITTSPGATITGQIVYEQGPPQNGSSNAPNNTVRVNAQIGDPDNAPMMGPNPNTTVAADGTFTLNGLQGEDLLRANGGGQFLKSVTLGGEDVTDTPHEFKPGDKVTVTMTSRASTLEGAVTDEKGEATSNAGIVLFSDDKAAWRTNSIRFRRTGADATGHYRIPGLPPGRYMVIAVSRENLVGQQFDAAYIELLSKSATSLVIGEDDQRQVDLKVVTIDTGGGH
jgi:hypothetical protein